MKLFSFKISSAILFLCGLHSFSAYSECLNLRYNTLSLGGQLTVPFGVDDKGDFFYYANISPQIGYFPINQLELILDIGYQMNPRSSDQSSTKARIGLTAEYFFLTKSIVTPYVGAGLSVYFNQKDVWLAPHVPVGTLIAIGPCVAVDLQIDFEALFSVATGFERFSIIPGYFGLRGFF